MEPTDDGSNILLDEFASLSEEFKHLKQLHKVYTETMHKVFTLQTKCNKELTHQNYRLSTIMSYLKYFEKEDLGNHPDLKEPTLNLKQNINQRRGELKDISNSLPQKNTGYLQFVLGSVNLSILSQMDKFKYKDDYEKFKLTVHIVSMFLSILNFFVDSHFLSMLFKFLLVWYYCILTLRESILKLNGSRIRGWWRFHHFAFVTLSGLFLLWPETDPVYVEHFRSHLLLFSVYISFVQYLQFKYQKEVLYRLRALGQGHDMDITVEGFHSFMFRGLGFLLPFHVIMYLFELNYAKILWTLWINHPEATWHIPLISSLFFIIFLGNVMNLVKAVPRKFRERKYLKGKFTVALEKMKKATSTTSLSVANRIRKLSSANSLANFTSALTSKSSIDSLENDHGNSKAEDQDFDENDVDDDLVFIIDKEMLEKVKGKVKEERYPLKKFLHLSHRMF